jgi:hypothetical protein
LINVDGNERLVVQRGKMAITRHEVVINALSHRAGNLYVNVSAVLGQHAWAIDETGMLETTRLDICNE